MYLFKKKLYIFRRIKRYFRRKRKPRKLRHGSKVSIFPLNIFNYGGTGVENGHSLRESSPEILRHLSSGKNGVIPLPLYIRPVGETGPIPQRDKFYWTPNKCDS